MSDSKSRTKSFRLPVEMYDAFDAYLAENEGMSPTDFIYDLLLEKLTETGHLTCVPERSRVGRPIVSSLDGGNHSYYIGKKLLLGIDRSMLLGYLEDLEVMGGGFKHGCKDCGKLRRKYKKAYYMNDGEDSYFIPSVYKEFADGQHRLCTGCYSVNVTKCKEVRSRILKDLRD